MLNNYKYFINLNADSRIIPIFAAASVVGALDTTKIFIIMEKVFCIICSSNHCLFEVCSSREVAESHLYKECYSVLSDAGLDAEIVERVICTK